MHIRLTELWTGIAIYVPIDKLYIEVPENGEVQISAIGLEGSFKRAGEMEISEPRMIKVQETQHEIEEILSFARIGQGFTGLVSAEDVRDNPDSNESYSVPNLEGLDIGSVWQHHNGNRYKIIFRTNTEHLSAKYPVHIVYENINTNTIWSRDARCWHKSFTKIPPRPAPSEPFRKG